MSAITADCCAQSSMSPLDNAQRVNPQVAETQYSSHLESILEVGRHILDINIILLPLIDISAVCDECGSRTPRMTKGDVKPLFTSLSLDKNGFVVGKVEDPLRQRYRLFGRRT